MLPFAQAGGAKPIAARDTNAGHLVGWVGGGCPSAPLPARTVASDGHTASTRAARQRIDQVCGEVMVQSDEQGNNNVRCLCWHLIHRYRGPPSPRRGRLNARSKGSVIFPVGRYTFPFCDISHPPKTLREGDLDCRSPHPPRSGPPSPHRGRLNARLKWGVTYNIERRGEFTPPVPAPAPR